MKKKRYVIDQSMVSEMRRLRGLNKSFDEIAKELNHKGFQNSAGGPFKMNHVAYLFKKTAEMQLGDMQPKEIPKSDLVDVVLRGPLQSEVKLELIQKIQTGEIADLNYTKIDIPEKGGRVFVKGNYANPASKIEVTIPGDRMKDRCKLVLQFLDEIKKIAES
jgi:hypothetical protein